MDFVSFEIAKKLKEKGFREKCLYRYRTYSKTLHPNQVKTKISRSIDRSEFYKCYNSFVDSDIDAPTISQVLKWLREEKKLHIAVGIWGGTWGYDLIKLPYGRSLHWTAYREDIKSYEDAALDGIRYVIDVLI